MARSRDGVPAAAAAQPAEKESQKIENEIAELVKTSKQYDDPDYVVGVNNDYSQLRRRYFLAAITEEFPDESRVLQQLAKVLPNLTNILKNASTEVDAKADAKAADVAVKANIEWLNSISNFTKQHKLDDLLKRLKARIDSIPEADLHSKYRQHVRDVYDQLRLFQMAFQLAANVEEDYHKFVPAMLKLQMQKDLSAQAKETAYREQYEFYKHVCDQIRSVTLGVCAQFDDLLDTDGAYEVGDAFTNLQKQCELHYSQLEVITKLYDQLHEMEEVLNYAQKHDKKWDYVATIQYRYTKCIDDMVQYGADVLDRLGADGKAILGQVNQLKKKITASSTREQHLARCQQAYKDLGLEDAKACEQILQTFKGITDKYVAHLTKSFTDKLSGLKAAELQKMAPEQGLRSPYDFKIDKPIVATISLHGMIDWAREHKKDDILNGATKFLSTQELLMSLPKDQKDRKAEHDDDDDDDHDLDTYALNNLALFIKQLVSAEGEFKAHRNKGVDKVLGLFGDNSITSSKGGDFVRDIGKALEKYPKVLEALNKERKEFAQANAAEQKQAPPKPQAGAAAAAAAPRRP